MLFIMKKSRTDLATSLIFLVIRVSKSGVDGWEKLRTILRFVHCTPKGKRAFGAKNIDKIFTWVDASYAVHHDMEIQTGGEMSIGLGVTYCRSSNTKIKHEKLYRIRAIHRN